MKAKITAIFILLVLTALSGCSYINKQQEAIENKSRNKDVQISDISVIRKSIKSEYTIAEDAPTEISFDVVNKGKIPLNYVKITFFVYGKLGQETSCDNTYELFFKYQTVPPGKKYHYQLYSDCTFGNTTKGYDYKIVETDWSN